ncbi:flagellar brake protein [Heliophilum fasciatum]|uniref:C-di-GMP-binding flagellar brake protein YcgR n=1 Tax=Heliophilum fasciatum TaxID=35700 RepID=A0A4R2S767_9FIRM|nr:PilZ domain-containing protein [Heliophilum fasciatum]MCW2277132.1 c-di-GMP-binding flagellar brake protein YcgR [Heliophilum fasciatum]TCP68231.1 c-di-GMP-binding flagellar brake protein YcgR [Heliophilum fasciatum]
MSGHQLKINDQLEFMVSDRNTYRGAYQSQVRAITDEVLFLDVPRNKERIMIINTNEQLEFYRVTETTIWRYRGTVMTQGVSSRLMKIKQPLHIDKIQRRNFFRVPVNILTKFARADETKPMGEWEWEETRVRDLSGGGLCLINKTPLKAGLQLVIDLPLNQETLQLWGEVKRVGMECDDEGLFYVSGVEFLDIFPSDQDLVVQYVFAKQRSLLRKGNTPGGEEGTLNS